MRRRTGDKGVCILLKGGSGTGKTLAGRVFATELKLGMYRIDLSAVVSKYIGETEKNLSAVFREAENTEAILFFDEADALFGKRTNAKDPHDRYANLDTNYLLQLIASFRGVVALATNHRDSLDDALLAHTRFEIDLTRRHAKRRI